tara:strand:+ start:19 stop:282 length:264 start_codon:yes stop_codon:yes gene_type:complete
MNNLLNKITRAFITGEGKVPRPTIFSYIQSLNEMFLNMPKRTQTEARRLDVAKELLREIKKNARQLQERVQLLEEQITVLEESKKGR